MAIPERHLGLHMPGDASLAPDYITAIAEHLEKHVDADALLEAAAAPVFPEESGEASSVPEGTRCCRIGVARDAAFCFYYHECALTSCLPPLHACCLVSACDDARGCRATEQQNAARKAQPSAAQGLVSTNGRQLLIGQ